MIINTQMIKDLKPCEDRLDNYLKHYREFSGSLKKFLGLKNITYYDKIWVAVRVLPREIVEVFAVDCAFSAAQHAASAASAAADYAAYAAAAAAAAVADYAAASAAAAAYAAVAVTAVAVAAYADYAYAADAAAYAERQNQIKALLYLCKGM